MESTYDVYVNNFDEFKMLNSFMDEVSEHDWEAWNKGMLALTKFYSDIAAATGDTAATVSNTFYVMSAAFHMGEAKGWKDHAEALEQ